MHNKTESNVNPIIFMDFYIAIFMPLWKNIKILILKRRKSHMLTTKEILTREEVMEILKIGRSTFYKLLQTGQLKGFKEGNRYKVPVESVEKYVEMRMRTWKNGMSFMGIPFLVQWNF